ncbi:ALOX8 lipoxygenase, partial [Malurus elegans]|nr:ALOX8 lipoxygenase [Malurus elegans]
CPQCPQCCPQCPRCPRCPSYVQGVVALFYGGDSDVAEDEELQEWVGEIFTYGVLGNEDTGRGQRGQ